MRQMLGTYLQCKNTGEIIECEKQQDAEKKQLRNFARMRKNAMKQIARKNHVHGWRSWVLEEPVEQKIVQWGKTTL